MNNFLSKIFLFFSILFLIICIGGNDFKKDVKKENYIETIIEKHKRLEMLSVNRVIFVGGSNLAFGIDSPSIEKEIGIPVVNLGLHAGLGLEFILNEIKSVSKSGDIIFLSIEYYLDIDGIYGLKKIASNSFMKAKNYYKYDVIKELEVFFETKKKNFKKNIHLINKFFDYTNEGPKVIETSIYSKKSFNSYGDMIGHLNKKSPGKLEDRSKISYRFYEGIELLNNFYKFAEANTIKVYFIYPNYPRSEYSNNIDAIEKYHIDLSRHLKIPIISIPKDFVFDDIMFFDTIYHLNKEGIKIRTKKIIEILQRIEF